MRGVDRQVQDVRKRAKLESLKDIYEEDENLVNDDNHYHAVINEIDKEAHAERDVVGEQADIAADEAADGLKQEEKDLQRAGLTPESVANMTAQPVPDPTLACGRPWRSSEATTRGCARTSRASPRRGR